jgi:ribosomal protein S18 acetylase RimI-like enzyme
LQPREDSAIEVALLLVDPAFQNTGIGKHVLLRVCDDASRAHLGVWLQTFKLNENARKFYLQLGFHIVGEDEHYFHFRRDPEGM